MEAVHIGQEVESEQNIYVYIRDTLGYVDGLMLPLLPTSTIEQVKGLILGHTDQLSWYPRLSFQGYSSLKDNKQIRDYDVQNGSTISVFTEFEIYLTYNAPERTRVSVIANTGANTQVIRLLALDKASKDTGFNPFEQVMTCAGQVLRAYSAMNESALNLGYYSDIVPGCEICFNKSNSK
jgi:hypothetical protein